MKANFYTVRYEKDSMSPIDMINEHELMDALKIKELYSIGWKLKDGSFGAYMFIPKKFCKELVDNINRYILKEESEDKDKKGA